MEMSRTNKWMIGTFAVLMIAHWLEHIFQAYQVYAMHMPRACALGMLGMKYPWLIKTEALHFGFAIFTTVGSNWFARSAKESGAPRPMLGGAAAIAAGLANANAPRTCRIV